MSENQHFCLKWNNHQSTLVSLFPSLLDTNTFVDCTLAAGGKQVHAHKVVLSACSPYLKELLVQHNDKHPIIILNNIKASELIAIVDFMYKGEVNISQENLAEFLKAAKTLQIKGLTDSEKSEAEPCDESVEEAELNQGPDNESPSGATQNEVELNDRKSPESGKSTNDLVIGDTLSSNGNFSENSAHNMSSIKIENWEDENVYEDVVKENNHATQVPFSVPVSLNDTLIPESNLITSSI
ncbi:hypothetical protein AAG570_013851 [Ranatra chinensis]|uniref:BTB domain-containing protein n=1 Tax=Ranatra chinensis TaxID=642074 RepID=A0ABD0YS30_9HEMI